MRDGPELIGVVRYVEFDFEIKITGGPVFSREEEYAALRRQGCSDIFGIRTIDIAGERSSIIDEGEDGCIIVPLVGNYHLGALHECIGQGHTVRYILQQIGNLYIRYLSDF